MNIKETRETSLLKKIPSCKRLLISSLFFYAHLDDLWIWSFFLLEFWFFGRFFSVPFFLFSTIVLDWDFVDIAETYIGVGFLREFGWPFSLFSSNLVVRGLCEHWQMCFWWKIDCNFLLMLNLLPYCLMEKITKMTAYCVFLIGCLRNASREDGTALPLAIYL